MLDTVAVNLKTGKDATGHISLRSAIMAADAQGGIEQDHRAGGHVHADDRRGRRGQRRHRRPGHQRQSSRSRAGVRASTIIDGNNLDRVFQVLSGKVSISKVTIQHGRADGEGGGMLNSRRPGDALVGGGRRTTWRSASGGRRARRLSVGGTGGDGPADDAEGGGIFNAAGSLSLTKSTIASNQAIGGDGGRRRRRRRRHGRRRHARHRRQRPAAAARAAPAAPAAAAWAAGSSTRPARA